MFSYERKTWHLNSVKSQFDMRLSDETSRHLRTEDVVRAEQRNENHVII